MVSDYNLNHTNIILVEDCQIQTTLTLLLTFIESPQQPSRRVLASSAGGPGFNPCKTCLAASYKRRLKNGTIGSLV